jgi:hypothetical protein
MITFTNAGTNTAFLNQTVKILPGGSIRFVGYPDEIDETVYNVSFASPGTGELYVFRKIYNSVYL